MAKNQVIDGDFKGAMVDLDDGVINLREAWTCKHLTSIDYVTVARCQIIGESYSKSATSAVGRAAVGAFFLGPVGLLAGLSAKNKGTHTIAVYFKDGNKSIVEVDDKIFNSFTLKFF